MSLMKDYIRSVGAERPPDLRPGDHFVDGLLVCGKCGKFRQKRIRMDGETSIVRCLCECDKEERDRKRQEEQDRENRMRVERLRNAGLLDSKYHDARFEKFCVDEDNLKAYKVGKNYVKHFDEMYSANQGVLFHGPVGTGKTFTAACIANALIEEGQPIIMTSFVKILQEIHRLDADEAQYLATLNKAKLLIIDDLGAERSTDYALEKTYNVIDSRVRVAKPMILTTNLTWEELTKEPDIRYRRIFDRILETCYPVYVPGKSRRLKKAAGRMAVTKDLLEADT